MLFVHILNVFLKQDFHLLCVSVHVCVECSVQEPGLDCLYVQRDIIQSIPDLTVIDIILLVFKY
jgi:hypothetical protein